MKIAWAILVIVLGVLGCSVLTTAAQTTINTPDSIPNLTGIWKGTSSGYMVGLGFTEDSMMYNITELNIEKSIHKDNILHLNLEVKDLVKFEKGRLGRVKVELKLC